ncbi:Ras protein-specific guanine nucleotide-releasing factor, partial [Xenoophorus captivus]
MMNSCKVLQIRYASVERLLERLIDLRFLSIDFLNTFLHSYRVFTSADIVLDKLITIYKKPISAIPARYVGLIQMAFFLFPGMSFSLELFFASSQNNKLLYGEPPTSPRVSRKFSSPPPLSITKNSSPNRRRKLSLNIPIITGGKALDLAALSCSPNGYASMHTTMSPFSKTTLDINKLYVSSTMASKIPDEGEPKAEGKVEDLVPSKQEFSLFSFNNGIVVSSCRELENNRSALSAASAFAIATAGANEGTPTKEKYRRMSLASTDQRNGDKEFVIRRAATNRVLNVLRHWVSKHSQEDPGDSQASIEEITQMVRARKLLESTRWLLSPVLGLVMT